MKVPLLLFALCAAAWSADPAGSPQGGDVVRVGDVVRQVRSGLAGLPPDVQRIAVYQFRADSREFRPGTVRWLQGKVEDAFATDGRRTVVNSPELRTLRVVSTDTSLSVSNSMPTVDELWKLAEKLHVDAFLEGTLARSPDNDLMLNLRVFRARSGELAWSGSWVSGPNREAGVFSDLQYTVYAPLRVFPMDAYICEQGSYANALLMTDFAVEAAVSEPVTSDRRVELSVSTGYTHLGLRGIPDSLGSPAGIHVVHLGVEASVVLVRKDDPTQGHWLSAYAGFDDFLPLGQRQHFGALRFGYRSRPTRHFSVGGGILLIPFGDHLADSPVLGTSRTFDLGWIAYEIDFLHFTF